jgi:acetyl esterase/lipase
MAFWLQNFANKSPSQGGPAGGIDAVRARYNARFERQFTQSVPEDIAFVHGQLGPVQGEWVRGARSDADRLILYFHGGGYVAGSPQSHRALTGRLAQASGIDAFSLRYRLAPECPFPAAVRDGIDAYRALLAKGRPGRSIVLAGDEAGGGLAFAVGLAIRNAGLEMPGAVAAMSPWADLSLSGLSMMANRKTDTVLDWETLFVAARNTLRKSNPGDAYASPAYASLKDFPPVMVHAGANELLRDDASKLGDRAAEAGVGVSVEIYDGMGHLFQADGSRGEARASLARLGQFLRARCQALAA